MNQQHQTVTASVADTDPRYHYTPHHISSSSSSSSSRTPSNHSSSDSSSTSTSTTRSSSATLVFRNNSHHHIVGGYQPYPKSIPSSTAVQPPPLSTSTTNTSVTCHWQDCGNVFDTELDVYNHIVARHAVKGKQECLMTRADSTLCRTSFMNKGNFIDHISSHFSSKLKPYACETCEAAFRNRQELRQHEMNVHNIQYARREYRKHRLAKACGKSLIGNTSVVGQPQQTQSRKSSSDSLDSSDASHHQQIVKVLASPPSSSSSVYPPPLPPPPLTQPVLLRSPTSSSHHQQPQQYQRFNQHPHPYHPAPPPPQVVTVCRAAPVVSATKSTTASVSSSTIQEVSQSPSAPLSPPIRLTPTSSSYPNPPRHGNDVDILDSLLSLSRKLLLPYDAANQLTSHDEGHSVLSSNDRSKLPLLVPHYSRNDKNYCKRRQYRHPIGIASLPPVHVYFNGSSSLSATRSVVGQFGIPEAFRKSSTNISEISASIFSVPPSLMPEMEIGLSWLHFMSNMELLSQKFKFDIPDIWNKLTIKAKERNGVISPAAQVEFTNWIVYAENLKLEDIIEVRRLKFAQRAGLLKTRTVQTLGQVIESLKQRFITSELLSSSPLPSSSTRWAAGKPLSLEYHASSSSTPTTSTTPHCASSSSSSSSSTSAASMCSYSSSPTPSEQQASSDNKFINPARELVLAFLRSNWESYLKWTNEEKAEFIEIADTSSAYHRDGSDCREQMLGLRVKVRYQFGAPALAIRKECVRACFEVFKDAIVESLPRIWGSEQEDNFIRLLCCNGSRCGRKEEIVVIHGGGGVYDAMAAEPGGACLLKARMDVVDVLGTDEIYIWLRMGHDEEWIQSNPPPHTAKVVPLAYVFQTL